MNMSPIEFEKFQLEKLAGFKDWNKVWPNCYRTFTIYSYLGRIYNCSLRTT